MVKYQIFGFIIFSALVSSGFSQDLSLYEKKQFISPTGDTLDYRIIFPENYPTDKDYPLVLFLHGAGERGSDNEKQLTHGADLFLAEENRKKFPAIVVFPQCPEDKYWIDISIRSQLGGKGDPDFKQSIKNPSEELALVNEMVEYL